MRVPEAALKPSPLGLEKEAAAPTPSILAAVPLPASTEALHTRFWRGSLLVLKLLQAAAQVQGTGAPRLPLPDRGQKKPGGQELREEGRENIGEELPPKQ